MKRSMLRRLFEPAARGAGPGERSGPDDATPLADLAAIVLDTETTGLDVAKDRIVSLAAVRVVGTRIDAIARLDLLVHPGVHIPARATAIHGITDAMVADAAPFAEAFGAFETFRAGASVIGHDLAFDLAHLGRAARRARLAWHAPLGLDTALLVAVLMPDLAERDLAEVAERLGVAIRGRHTALGDALLTAEIYVRLVPLLTERGVGTLGEARAFAAGARKVMALQRAAGWWDER